MGYPMAQLWQISTAELKKKLEDRDYRHFFNVRIPAEWVAGPIKEAKHLPLTELLRNPPGIPKDEEVIVTCGVGYRGNIAASFLQGEGFEHVHSLAGGMKAWVNAGHPVAL